MPSSKTCSTERPVFTITLRPEPGVDAVRAIKALLKTALRAYKLRAVRITHASEDAETEAMSEAYRQPVEIHRNDGTLVTGWVPCKERADLVHCWILDESVTPDLVEALLRPGSSLRGILAHEPTDNPAMYKVSLSKTKRCSPVVS
jgi:hypothetical protein